MRLALPILNRLWKRSKPKSKKQMDTPVYKSLKLGRVVEYETIFPNSQRPDISACMRGFSREHLIGGLIVNLINKLVNKPFYNPNYHGGQEDIDVLRFYLSGANVDVIRHSIIALQETAYRENRAIQSFLGATEETALCLLREIMAMEGEGGQKPIREIEQDYYKALLVANSLTINKGYGEIPYQTDDIELYLASCFLTQFGSADFIYNNKHLLLLTQTVKCIRFFEYAVRDEMLNPLVDDFCHYYGITNWWLYPKAFWSVYAITDGKAGIINMENLVFEEAVQYLAVINKSSIPCYAVVSKEQNVDYTAFRAKPLLKLADSEFVVFNIQFIIERIYTGLYFDFRTFAENRGVSRSDFKRHFSTDFSEHTLFCDALKQSMKNHFEVLMTEDDCKKADVSKDADQASPPDFYARKGDVVLLFENKDILLSQDTKEAGTVSAYIDFLRTRLYQNEKGKPKGVVQLLNLVGKIRSGEFQKRWDSECPTDAVVYPVLIVPEAKFTMFGVKNFLQRWQKESEVSNENVRPVALADIGTICLYQHEFAKKGILSYLDEYYEQSDFKQLDKSRSMDDVPNAMMSFTDYLCHNHNDTLSLFGEEWEKYLRMGE